MKIISFLKSLLINAFYVLMFLIIAGCVYIYSYRYYDVSRQDAALEEQTLITDNFYSSNKDESSIKNVSLMNDFLSSLPSNVSALFQNKWAIVLVDEMPLSSQDSDEDTKEPGASDAETVGYCDWRPRLIYVKTQTNPEKLLSTFVHELGHVFDYEFGTPSETDEFKLIYSLYKGTYKEDPSFSAPDYISSTPAEFFATIFKDYLLYPEHLQSSAPEAYEFIGKLYNEASEIEAANTSFKYDLQSVLLNIKKQFKRGTQQ